MVTWVKPTGIHLIHLVCIRVGLLLLKKIPTGFHFHQAPYPELAFRNMAVGEAYVKAHPLAPRFGAAATCASGQKPSAAKVQWMRIEDNHPNDKRKWSIDHLG